MKTLDEVIEAQKRCTTYPNCHFCYLHSGSICEWIRDALHYLKDMKNLEEDYDILYNKYWREFNQQQANPPLTWDELKQMEGKPVWVEHLCGVLRWGVIDDLFYDQKEAKTKIRFGTRHGFLEWDKDDQGKTWQAYRKERC